MTTTQLADLIITHRGAFKDLDRLHKDCSELLLNGAPQLIALSYTRKDVGIAKLVKYATTLTVESQLELVRFILETKRYVREIDLKHMELFEKENL